MELLKSMLSGGVGAGVVAGLFGVWQWWLARKAQQEDKAADQKATSCAERGREIADLKTMVENLIIADRAILYDRIKHLAKTYIKRDWITMEEYEDLKRMHKVYHDQLQGNGFLDSIMRDVDDLEKKVL